MKEPKMAEGDRKMKNQISILNLHIYHLKKESAVQSKIIQQLKTLYESSRNRNINFCDAGHRYCRIQHSKNNYVNMTIQD